MDVVFAENGAFTQLVIDRLEGVRLAESGKVLRACTTRIANSTSDSVQEYAPDTIFVTSIPCVCTQRFLEQHPDGGIVVISARDHLDEQSALRKLLRLKLLAPSNTALFATRDWSLSGRSFADSCAIQAYTHLELSREGIMETTDAIMTYVRSWPQFHIMLDLDVLDPAFAPGLMSPKPAGLTSRELLYVLQRLRLIKTLVSVEIISAMELADASTASLLARLIAELR